MQSKEYMENVKRTESLNFNASNTRLLHGAIGCCTEAGELMDVMKKSLFYGREIDRWNLIEEIGDMFWYLALMCDELDYTFENVMDMNIAKLKKRYPKQFTKSDEQNRDYEQEQKAAETKMPDCFSNYKNLLSCCECLFKGECQKKGQVLNEKP